MPKQIKLLLKGSYFNILGIKKDSINID